MRAGDAFGRFRSVEEELHAARFAVGTALRAASRDATYPDAAESEVRPTHLRACAANLETTYLLRLFAEFEAVARDYWSAARPSPRPRRARMEVLIDRIAADRQVPYDQARGAHEVRDLRNSLVHSGAGTPLITFAQCKSRLATFVSYLPRQW